MKFPNQPISPISPYAPNFEERTVRVYVYEYTQSLRDEWERDEEDEDIVKNTLPIEEINLEWLMSHVPEGIKFNEIKIEFDYHTSSMAYENHYIKFYYEKIIPDRKKEYQALKNEYDKDLKIYHQAMIDWKESCRILEIQETEQKLKELKRIK